MKKPLLFFTTLLLLFAILISLSSYGQAGYSGAYFSAAPGLTGTYWNPSDKSPLITLSNANLTESAGAAGVGFVRATAQMSVGTQTISVTYVTGGGGGGGLVVGLEDGSAANTSQLWSSTKSIVVVQSSGAAAIWVNGVQVQSGLANINNGDVLRIIKNSVANTVQLQKNGVNFGALQAITSGAYYPAAGKTSGLVPTSCTADFSGIP